MNVFCERLHECRKNKSLTQRQIASLLEITERSYQRYELGVREPNIQTLVKIADILDPVVIGGNTTYFIQLEGENAYYRITVQQSLLTVLLRKGDEVTVVYDATAIVTSKGEIFSASSVK